MENNKYSSVLDAINKLKERGYGEDFMQKEGMLCTFNSCSRLYEPSEVTLVEFHRLEGPSNPDDMSIVYVIETKDGVKGTIVNAYGAYSDPKINAFFKNVTKATDSQKSSHTPTIEKY